MKQFFRKHKTADIAPTLLSTAFTTFTIPEKEEGFADVKYEWFPKAKSAEHLKAWVQNMKLTTRIEDLQPGEWFTKQWAAWQQQLQQWHAKKTELELARKAEVAKAAAEREAKRRKILDDKAAAEKKAKEAEEKKDEEMKDGEAKEGEEAEKKE